MTKVCENDCGQDYERVYVYVTSDSPSCCVGRGDINHAGDGIDISDLVYLVDYMFTGGAAPTCLEEADIDGSGGIDISDLVYLVDYMFTGGEPPVPCGAVPPMAKTGGVGIEGLSVEYAWYNGTTTISLNSPIDIRGVQLELEGSGVGAAVNLLGDRLDLVVGQVAGTTRIGLLDLDGAEVIKAGTNPIIRLDGTYEVVSAKVADTRPQTYLPEIVIASKEAELPLDYSLSQNYPNPFNPSTTIAFGLPQAGHVRLTVFNLLGQTVANLVDGDYSAGEHSAEWNGANNEGQTISSGVYFYRLETEGYIETRKMLLLK